MRSLNHLLVCCMALIHLVAVAVNAAPEPSPATPPLGEQWFKVSANGKQAGFAFLRIRATPTGYEIRSESSVNMTVLGFSRRAALWESYQIERDLSLRSFKIDMVLDGKRMHRSGSVVPGGVRVTTVTRGGEGKDETIKANGKVYPAPVLNFYPIRHEPRPGAVHKVQMLDVEEAKIRKVKVSVEGLETNPEGLPVIRLQNNLYPVVQNEIWIDRRGRTIRESVRDGLVLTEAEDPAAAARFIAEASLAGDDTLLDFSLIPVRPAIERFTSLKRFVLDITGVPDPFDLPQGGGQQAERLQDGPMRVRVERPVRPEPEDRATVDRLTATGPGMEAPELTAIKGEILAGTTDRHDIPERIVLWVAANISHSTTGNSSPLETLQRRTGTGLDRARLCAALARSAGVPTRVVHGLTYREGSGFVYHSWTESLMDAWVPFDPSSGQSPADVGHIKLLEEDSPDALLLLAGLVGHLKVEVVEAR